MTVKKLAQESSDETTIVASNQSPAGASPFG